MEHLFARLIMILVRRSGYAQRRWVVTFAGRRIFKRYEPLWFDEWVGADGERYHRAPWWRPFYVMLHCWRGGDEEMHDHPRWTITLCLRGRMTEVTPWGERVLTPGSLVIRSRKAIHAFRVDADQVGRAWTLFIAGRRNHRQNTYSVTNH